MITIQLNAKIIDSGERYAQSRRLPYDHPWEICEVAEDMLLPYFRVHIAGRCVGFTDTLQQAYDVLHNLPPDAVELLKEES